MNKTELLFFRYVTNYFGDCIFSSQGFTTHCNTMEQLVENFSIVTNSNKKQLFYYLKKWGNKNFFNSVYKEEYLYYFDYDEILKSQQKYNKQYLESVWNVNIESIKDITEKLIVDRKNIVVALTIYPSFYMIKKVNEIDSNIEMLIKRMKFISKMEKEGIKEFGFDFWCKKVIKL